MLLLAASASGRLMPGTATVRSTPVLDAMRMFKMRAARTCIAALSPTGSIQWISALSSSPARKLRFKAATSASSITPGVPGADTDLSMSSCTSPSTSRLQKNRNLLRSRRLETRPTSTSPTRGKAVVDA